jgi:hypothetical protein
MHDVRDNTVTNPFVAPFRMVEELKGNPEFRKAFAARVQKHFFGDGALTPAACAARWMKRAKEVDVAIIAESARWGYYLRKVPYTRDKEWADEQQRLLKEYFPHRTEIVLKQLQRSRPIPNQFPARRKAVTSDCNPMPVIIPPHSVLLPSIPGEPEDDRPLLLVQRSRTDTPFTRGRSRSSRTSGVRKRSATC